mgnify:CR=1 FL=1
MRVIFFAVFILVPVVAGANSETEVAKFTERFYQQFNSSSDPGDLRKFFAKSPVFQLGEQPAISSDANFSPRMIEILRESMGVADYPYTGLVIDISNISDDGSATLAVVFKRAKSKNEYQKALCSIFSLAKLKEGWKIIGWSMYGTTHESRCTWA